MPGDKSFYYLTSDEIRHYQYMLDNNYTHKIVELPSQKYIVFPVVNKEQTWIAWPTTSGKLDGQVGDAIFEPCLQLQSKLLPIDGVVGLLFPRYSAD